MRSFALSTALAFSVTSISLCSQEPAPASQQAAQKKTPPGGEPVEWMAVSIHPTDPSKADNWSANDQPNGITLRGSPISALISQAYGFGIMPMRDEEMEGLPEWAKSNKYDIEARVSPEDAPAFHKISNLSTADLIVAYAARKYTGEMLMEQQLLTDRFHFKAHWETRERNVYQLVVAKNGSLLKTAADPEHGSASVSSGTMSGKGVPVVFLANLLQLPAERKVIDRTELTGAYDFELHFAPINLKAGSETSNDPDFFSAVQQQLGLKLQAAKMPIPVLIVEHIDLPTPN